MGIKDTVTKDYMKDRQIFADAFNNYIYGGKRVIDPEKLSPADTTTLAVPYGADGAFVPIQKFRDELQVLGAMEDKNAVYVLLGGEWQSEIHYAMPVKDMLYDAAEYAAQVEAAARSRREARKKALENKEQPDGQTEEKKETGDTKKAVSPGEYLSGFHKNDRLVPVITLVIYFGPDEWDGPRSLREMFAVEDEKILALVPDYRINLLAPAEMSDEQIDRFETSLREVLLFLKYSKDKEKLVDLAKRDEGFSSLDLKAIRTINTLTGHKLKIEESEEKVVMRNALDEIREDGIAEGMAKGVAEGTAKGIAKGIAEGIAEGRVKGIAEGEENIVIRFLKSGMYSLEELAKVSGFEIGKLMELQKTLEKS